MKSVLVKRVLSFILAAVLLAGNVMPVMAEGSVSGNDVAEVTVEETTETVEEESVVSEETSSVEEVSSEEQSSEVSTEQTTEESSSVESTTEESTEQTTEVSTEETTEDSVSENEIPEDELSVSVNEIIDEEVPLAGALPVSLEPVTVNGITITVSGPASAFAEGTTVSAVEVEPAEVVIEAAEESEQAEVKRYKAFDINLVCDGEVVQPLNGEEITVNFEGDLLIPDTDSEEDVVVYHVDDNDEITKMEAEVATVETEDAAEVETVEMTTTHFSTYVVMVTGKEGKVRVTINHYPENMLNKSREEKDRNRLFVTDVIEEVDNDGGTIEKFVKGEGDYSVVRINAGSEEFRPTREGDYKYEVNTTEDTLIIDVYYRTIGNRTVDNDITIFDYKDGNAYNNNSINYYGNYPNNVEWNRRMATKGAASNYAPYLESVSVPGHWTNVNNYDTTGGKDGQTVEGLLQENALTGDSYQNVNFTFQDPGFFSKDEKRGKTIYSDEYSLSFAKDGLKHTLRNVKREAYGRTYVAWSQLDNFWPLDERNHNNRNEYFGIRYDFDFQIGDYVGDMTYKFAGDDDLWVCLDGKVILDLGGIHGKVEGSVNVWEKLTGKTNPTYADKVAYLEADADGDGIANGNEKKTVTVLYMERGGSKSNCNMEFVMPNIIPKDPVITDVPKANLELVKKNSETQAVIADVGFKLFIDRNCTNEKTNEYRTNNDGKVIFENLRAGTYYLKETFYDMDKYKLNDTVYKVDVTVNNNVASIALTDLSTNVAVPKADAETYIIYNTPKTSLEFVKVDSKDSSVVLAGAEFELTSTTDASFKKTSKFVDGKYIFEDIDAGVYTLKETKAPEGYLVSDETLTVTVEVKEDGILGYTVTGTAENDWLLYEKEGDTHFLKNTKPVDIEIIKEWKNYKGEALADDKITMESITVELYREVEGLINSKEKVQDVVIEKATDWKTTVEDLPSVGKDGEWKYSVVEKAINGFEAAYRVENDQNRPDTIILVVTNTELVGNLKITKTVNKVDSVHGIAAFTFKITCPDESILYRTISFEGDLATDTSKEVVIKNLPVGSYKVEELTALRYECKSENPQEKDVVKNTTTEYNFRNEKEYDGNYSHTDVIVNKVVFNEDGSVTMTQEKSSVSE